MAAIYIYTYDIYVYMIYIYTYKDTPQEEPPTHGKSQVGQKAQKQPGTVAASRRWGPFSLEFAGNLIEYNTLN